MYAESKDYPINLYFTGFEFCGFHTIPYMVILVKTRIWFVIYNEYVTVE